MPPPRKSHVPALLLLVLFAAAPAGLATPNAPRENPGVFNEQVNPLLAKYCVSCHGATEAKADFTVHDIDGAITRGKDTVRWEKVLEMMSLQDMPPEDKPQPTKLERQRITTWIAGELKKIGRGHDEIKLALPQQANRVSHEALFSGEHKGPAFSPPRLWRKSPQIYSHFAREMRTAVAQPLLGLGGKGVQDYASLYADEATIQTMLRNSHLVADSLMNKPRARLNHLFKAGAEPKPADVDRAIVHLFQLFFQREPTADDRARYIDGLFKKNLEVGGLSVAMRTLIVGMLLSQEFVFRQEVGLGPKLPDGRRRLSPDELAYALSFAFYDKPDRTLLEAAKRGKLATREDVRREVRRILGTPDAQRRYWHYPMYHRWGDDYYQHRPRVLRFFQEFFGYTGVVDVFKDRERNHHHHANRLRKDADMLVLQVLERDKDVIAELLTTHRYPMDHITPDRLKRLLDPKNGQYRGVRDAYGDAFATIAKEGKWPGVQSQHVSAYNLDPDRAREIRRGAGEPVTLPKDQRAGMLTHPAWLVAHSGNFENDPIRRGKWIREHLLADLVPEVPIGVDAKVPEDPHRTLKERLDLVRNEACWRCHRKMNPLGETFESYDDFGRYRHRIVLGDANAYFKAKRKHDGQKARWQKELRDWQSYDAAGRATKIAEAEAALASLKKPDASEPNYKKALKSYESSMKRWTRERDHWRGIDDAEQRRRIANLKQQIAKLTPPVAKTKPVDARGVLDGTGDPALDGPVKDAIDLTHRLAKSERVRQSFIRHAFRYWLGRNETLNDSPTLMAADRAYVDSEGSFKAMLTSLLTSDSFLYRKDPSATER